MAENYAWEEYKLLQEKIDKIGEFQFTVRGWAITLITGFFIGGAATKLPAWFFLSALIIVLLFWLLEKYELIWRDIYISRVSSLEQQLRKKQLIENLDIASDQDISPGIARATRDAFSRKHSWLTRAIVNDMNAIFYLTLAITISLYVIIASILGPF